MSSDLKEALPETDRNFVILGLQALWRERVMSYQVAEQVAKDRGVLPLGEDEFGIGDVVKMLRRFGAEPPSF